MSDYFDRVERQLVRNVQAGLPRSSRFPIRSEQLAFAVAVLAVVAVVAVFLGARGPNHSGSPVNRHGVTIVFGASPTGPRSPPSSALERSVEIFRQRLDSVFHGIQVSRAGDQVIVVVPDATAASRARIVALAAPGRLAFYDWEANALTPNGKTAASQLQKQDPIALEMSQGSGVLAPGSPGAGSMPLYSAVKLAARQRPQKSSDNGQVGSEYYLFGAPGSAACAAVARDQGTTATPGIHCLLSGTDSGGRHDLLAGLPSGVSASQGQELIVPQGTAVLQAAAVSPSHPVSFNDPGAQFFVLRDHVSLSGNDIAKPRQSTDQSGNPDVQFGFTAKGKTDFTNATAAIARRGDLVSGLGQTLDQHFAIALDGQLITVPSIDFKSYPDGIQGDSGADITAGFTIQAAQQLATLLRFGPLPVELVLR